MSMSLNLQELDYQEFKMFAMACIDKQTEQERKDKDKQEQKRQKQTEAAEGLHSSLQSSYCTLL